MQYRYAYHDLYDKQFEQLVVAICQELFGPGVQEFSTGPDGGRDARFCGVALAFPSSSQPWKGITVIQAKHTESPIEKFSESGFSSKAKSSVLSAELPRIKHLYDKGHLNNYILFSNRRLGAEANQAILDRISTETGLNTASIHLCGIEGIERHLKTYRRIAQVVDISPLEAPLRVSPDELADVIIAFAKAQSNLPPAESIATKIERTRFDEKNQINGLTSDYADLIQKRFLKHFGAIRQFLGEPANETILERYQEAALEFSAKIIEYNQGKVPFDRVLGYLFERLLERDVDLRANRRLTRALLYYMYWNCDIGKSKDATPD
ncbi:MAG TPA: ABC-three component system protein [Archangium sp.]|nr:ABC-three component system protein [Archangium sp.]